MLAQIVRASFEKRNIGRQSAGPHQSRDIFTTELFLKRFTRRTHDNATACDQSWGEIRKGLTGTCSCFSQKLAFALKRLSHSQSKLDLSRTRNKPRRCVRQRAVRSKSLPHTRFVVLRENCSLSDSRFLPLCRFRRTSDVVFKLSKRDHRRINWRRDMSHLLEIIS